MKFSDAFPDDDVPLVQIEQQQPVFPNITMQEYIAVLQAERETLLKDYYKPQSEGTGHYNTAASVLEFRITELSRGL
jgi:hypothetical protein